MTSQNNDFAPEDIVYYGKDFSRLPTRTTGDLEIILKYDDGREIVHDTLKNIIVYGFGLSIANLLTKKSTSKVSNFGIKYFKVGTRYQLYSNYTYPNNRVFFDLATPLNTRAKYGRNLRTKIVSKPQLESANFLYDDVDVSSSPRKPMAELSDFAVTRLNENTINTVVKIGKNMANNQTLTEIGLFIKNPECTRKETPVLAAYKTFRPIPKTSDFEIIFNWNINIVDISDQSSWEVVEVDYPEIPLIEYESGYGSEPFPFPLTSGIASSFSISILENLEPGTLGVEGPLPNTSIDSTTGELTFNVSTTGKFSFDVTGVPTDIVNFGTSYTKTFYANVEELYVPPVSGTDANYEFGQNLATIRWTTPDNVPIGTSAIVKAIIPVSSTDLTGTYPHFIIKDTSTICQVNPVTYHADGVNTVEVAFSATTTAASGSTQTFTMWSVSTPSITSSNVPLPAWFSSLNTALVDYNNKTFQVDFITSSNPTVLSSIEKSGHWETTYKFYGRMYNTGNATRDYALGCHAFVTVRRNDPVVNVDMLFNNGNMLLNNTDLPGVNNTKQNNWGIVGDFWFTNMAVVTPPNTSAIQDFDSWNFGLLTSGSTVAYTIAPNYPAAGGVKHCFPRNKHYTLRFSIAPLSYIESISNAGVRLKGKARKDYIGFATAGARTFFNMRAWGIAMDYMPKLVDSDFAVPQGFYANLNTNTPGLAGQNELFRAYITQAETLMRTGIGNGYHYPGYNGITDLTGSKNFWIVGLQNMAALEAGVSFKNPLMGSRLLNSELNYLQLQADRIGRRTPYAIYAPSGNAIGSYDLFAQGPPWYGQTAFNGNIPNSSWDPSGVTRMIRFGEGGYINWQTYGEIQQQMFPEFAFSNANVADIPTLTNYVFSNPYFRSLTSYKSSNQQSVDFSMSFDVFNRSFAGSHHSLGALHLYNFTINTNDPLGKQLLVTYGCNIALSKPQYHNNVGYYGADLATAGGNISKSLKTSLEGRRYIDNQLNGGTIITANGVSSTYYSHRGWRIQTHRWDAWDAFVMVGTYQIAPQEWKTKYTEWFNLQASCLAYGWIQENGFWDGREYQTFEPHPNQPLQAFLAGNYWSQSPEIECSGINWLGSGRVQSTYSNGGGYTTPDNTEFYPYLGNGIIPDDVGVAQSLEVNYMMLTALGLYRTLYRNNSFIKSNITSALALQGSSYFFEPGLQIQQVNITPEDYALAGAPQQNFQNLLTWATNNTAAGVMYFFATKLANNNPQAATKKGFTIDEIVCSSLYSGRSRSEDVHNGIYIAAIASSLDNADLITSSNKFLLSGTAISQGANYIYNTWPNISDRDKYITQLNTMKTLFTVFTVNANFGTYALYHLAYIKKVLGLQ